MKFRELVSVLQLAISPVILISGIGLLLLSMTNRLGRVIDRSRLLLEVLRQSPEPARERIRAQLRILSDRARLVRMTITWAAVSLLLAAILIIALFLSALYHFELALVIIFLFCACMVSLIGSLAMFTRDINLSLAALKLEMDSAREDSPES
ncbi:MAG: DUF2721 domain-containing protein [Candidatus Omnitrophica bacterium]|nr:DUF2721 domain-containing protein [Candidatus Omnitrophota bacterium]